MVCLTDWLVPYYTLKQTNNITNNILIIYIYISNSFKMFLTKICLVSWEHKQFLRLFQVEADGSILWVTLWEPLSSPSSMSELMITRNLLSRKAIFTLHQDLSYGDILAGRPGAWLVKKKKKFICMQSQNFKKTPYWNSKCFPEHVSFLW